MAKGILPGEISLSMVVWCSYTTLLCIIVVIVCFFVSSNNEHLTVANNATKGVSAMNRFINITEAIFVQVVSKVIIHHWGVSP